MNLKTFVPTPAHNRYQAFTFDTQYHWSLPFKRYRLKNIFCKDSAHPYTFEGTIENNVVTFSLAQEGFIYVI